MATVRQQIALVLRDTERVLVEPDDLDTIRSTAALADQMATMADRC